MIAVAVMTQGGLNGDDSETTQTSSSTTSSTTPSTTTSTSTYSQTSSNTTNTSDYASIIETPADTVNDQAAEEKDVRFTQTQAGSFDGVSIQLDFRVGVQFLIMSSMFFGLMLAGYTMVYNPEDLRSYVNQSLQLAGYHSIVGSWGKAWEFAPGCQIKIRGLVNPEMQITMPLGDQVLGYGFRIVGDLAETFCHIDQLPVKLQLIQLYLEAMQNE